MKAKSHTAGKDRVQTSRLQTAAKCALADLLGEYDRGGLPEPARRSIVELYDALVGDGVDMDDYTVEVKQIRALRD